MLPRKIRNEMLLDTHTHMYINFLVQYLSEVSESLPFPKKEKKSQEIS